MMMAVLAHSVAVLAVSFVLLRSESISADEIAVDLELVLAVDASLSMDMYERQLQRRGYVAAFRSPAVIEAILSGPRQRIVVAYVEWGDPETQVVVIPWTIIDGTESSERFAARLHAAPINRFFGTSIAQALAFSDQLLGGNGFFGDRSVIDISGDGPNNLGPPVVPVRDTVVSHGVTINGLPIMIRTRWGGGLYNIVGLDEYYRDCVIGGATAFIVAVRSLDRFAEAIERKLIMEIVSTTQSSSIVPIADIRPPAQTDCLAGERNSGRLLPHFLRLCQAPAHRGSDTRRLKRSVVSPVSHRCQRCPVGAALSQDWWREGRRLGIMWTVSAPTRTPSAARLLLGTGHQVRRADRLAY